MSIFPTGDKPHPADANPIDNGLADADHPMVSAIISTYNSEQFIRGCLEDLLTQSIAHRLEIIVIDSASKQNEAAIVRDFQTQYPRITYLRTLERESVYTSWNRGIKIAKGKYVTNANTDDRHRPDAFEKMVAVLEAEPKIALVYADVIKTNQPNQTMAACTPTGVLRWYDWRRELLLTEGCFIGPQPMWRRNVHDVFGFFDESMTVAADYEFWLRISQVFDFRRISEPLGLYLERNDSVEHAHPEKKRAEERMIHRRYSDAAAAGRILSFNPLEMLRRGAAAGQRELMRQAVNEIERICESTNDGAADNIKALCGELAAAMAQGAILGSNRMDRFIQQASHYFLTRGAEHCADAARIAAREAIRTSSERCPEGVYMMPFAEKIQQGVRCLLNSGHLETAQWMLDKLLAEQPGCGPAHHERAILAHQQGDLEQAGLHFRQAAAMAPENALFQKSLGDYLHVVQKNIDAAIAQYQKVLTLTPNDLETLLLTAHLYTASHRFDQARIYYQKVLKLAPDHSEAKEMFDQLSKKPLTMQPTASPEMLYQKACLQATQCQHQEAAHTLEQVIAMDPRHALAHNDLGVIAFENGDNDKAQRLYEKACELAPYNGVFQKNLGDFYYFERKDVEKALGRYVQALTLDPKDVESLMATGHICMALGQSEDARVFYERTLEIEPWNAEAQRFLQQLMAAPSTHGRAMLTKDLYAAAQNCTASGDRQGAIHILTQLTEREPHQAQAYNDLGVLHYEEGNKQRALQNYEQAVRLAPQDTTFLKNLADFYFVEQGRIEDALRIYIQILESNREDVESLEAAGTICLSIGKSEDARVFFERILEIEPWHAVAREQLDRVQKQSSIQYGGHIATLARKRA